MFADLLLKHGAAHAQRAADAIQYWASFYRLLMCMSTFFSAIVIVQ
jgi:hypothetical protein